jgi:hypothetical protein
MMTPRILFVRDLSAGALLATTLGLLAAAGCGNSAATPAAASADTSASDSATGDSASGDSAASSTLPVPYQAFYNVTSIAVEGDQIVIRTKDLPDHKSPFYGKASAKYEAYNGTNASFSTAIQLPNGTSDPILGEQDATLRLPKSPKEATSHTGTSLGPIGVAINGVLIYNQYNGAKALLGSLEINNLDQYNGHPTPAPSLAYHYHSEPLYLTKTKGDGALVGFLLDGFPVYGPVENGKRLKTADLDKFHGHSHATTEYPAGTYHYHVTDDAPWINGDGYFGTPGTVTE